MKLSKDATSLGQAVKRNIAALVAEKCSSGAMRAARSVSSSHTVLSSVHVAGSIDLLDVAVQSDCNIAGSCKLTDVRIADNCAIAGSATCIKVTIGGTLYVAGSCKANNLVVRDVSSSGSMKVNNATIAQSLEAWGGLAITNSRIRGLATVQAAYRGSFYAQQTSFKDLEIVVDRRSGHLNMSQVTVDFVVIRKNSTSGFSLFGMQIIPPVQKATIVLDATIVDGDVEFQDLTGTVILRNGSQVRGQVLGGAVITQ